MIVVVIVVKSSQLEKEIAFVVASAFEKDVDLMAFVVALAFGMGAYLMGLAFVVGSPRGFGSDVFLVEVLVGVGRADHRVGWWVVVDKVAEVGSEKDGKNDLVLGHDGCNGHR